MNNLPDFPFSSIKQIYRFSLSQFVCTHNLVPRKFSVSVWKRKIWVPDNKDFSNRQDTEYDIDFLSSTSIFTITAQIFPRSLANFYRQ